MFSRYLSFFSTVKESYVDLLPIYKNTNEENTFEYRFENFSLHVKYEAVTASSKDNSFKLQRIFTH